METALKAIAAPRRRQILTLVRDGELSAGEIASHFEVTRPAVSQDLTLLKEAGLVTNGATAQGVSTARVPRAWSSCEPSWRSSGLRASTR